MALPGFMNFFRGKRLTAIVLLLFTSGFTASITLIIYEDIISRPISLPGAERLVFLGGAGEEPGQPWPAMWNQGAFTELGLFQTVSLSVAHDSNQQTVLGCLADAAFFRVIGASPWRGRLFIDEDSARGALPVAVVSDAYWKSNYGAVENLDKAGVSVAGRRFRIVGVLEPGMSFPARAAIYLPRPDRSLHLGSPGDLRQPDDIAHGSDRVIGRLREGVTIAQARQMEGAILEHLRAANTNPHRGIGDRVNVTRVQDVITLSVRKQLGLLAVAGSFVALVGMGSLLLLSAARAAELRKDIAIRIAIGGSTRRIFLLDVWWWLGVGAGASVAIIVATHFFLRVARSAEALAIPRLDELHMHPGQVLWVCFGTVAAAALLALPYLTACLRMDAVAPILNQSGSESRLKLRGTVGKVVSVCQLSLALALTTATIRVCANYWQAARAAPGIDARDVFFRNLTVAPFVSGPLQEEEKGREAGLGQGKRGTRLSGSVPDGTKANELLEWRTDRPTNGETLARRGILDREAFEAVDELRQGPDVASAALVEPLPYRPGSGSSVYVAIENRSEGFLAQEYRVHGDLPQTMGMKITLGRWFDEQDERDATQVAVVSQLFAVRAFGGQAIGNRVHVGDEATSRIIIGVVSDVLAGYGEDLEPAVYLPIAPRQGPASPHYALIARARSEAMLRAGEHGKRPGGSAMLQFGEWMSLSRLMSDAGLTDEAGATASGWFALLVLLIAATSTYAVVWTLTMQRQREMAIRICMGALPQRIANGIFIDAAILIGIAGFGGFAIGRGLQRLLWSQIYGFPTFSWSSFVASLGIIALATLASVWIPARSVLRFSAAEILRGN